MTQMMEDPSNWPEVVHNLLTREQAIKLQGLTPQGEARSEVKNWLPFAEYARELCHDNYLLFGRIFMGLDPAPHLWKKYKQYRLVKKRMWRLPRGGGKTEVITIPKMTHRVCYATQPGSRWVHNSLLTGFESKEKAVKRIKTVQRHIESGGAGRLIHLAFPVVHNNKVMTIKEYAKETGSWTPYSIDFVRIDGSVKKEPVLQAMSPEVSGVVGEHPTEFLFDDYVGRKGAQTPHMRNKVSSHWSQVLSPMVNKEHTTMDYIHTVYHDDDQSMRLASTNMYRLIEQKALNRYPNTGDYKLVVGKDGETRIFLTDSAQDLKSFWPCPTGNEYDCPATESHYKEVGYHRPVKDLIRSWITDPLGFANQMMHDPRATDAASVKPYMMRFYVWSPDDPRVGKPAPYHKDWDEFKSEAAKHGIPMPDQPPLVEAFPDVGDIIFRCHAWDLSYGKDVSTSDETVCCARYRTRDGKVFHRFDAGHWRHGTTMKKVCINTDTDPTSKAMGPIRIVGLPGGGTESKVEEAVEDTRKALGMHHSFQVKVISRHRSKDEVFQNSGYAAMLANGYGYFDLDDGDTIRQFLSVTPDESGGHDDRFDAAIYAHQTDPGGSGGGLFAVSTA